MTKELLKTLLNYEFFDKYQHKITENLFPEKHIRGLFRTLQQSHLKNKSNLSVEDLKVLHYAYNPALTAATKHSLDGVFEELDKVTVNEGVAEDTLRQAIRTHLFTEAASLCMDAADNKTIDFLKLKEMLNDVDLDLGKTKIEYVTTDLDALLLEDDCMLKWHWHLPGLQEVLGGIGNATFTLAAGRPNSGKTAFVISSIYHPEGWLAQGARVHLVANEEKATRTQLRGISAYTGISKLEMKLNPHKKEEAKELWAKIKQNICTVDSFGISLTELEDYVKNVMEKDEILILDQIDKIKLIGNFGNEAERIRTLFTHIREMGKRYDIPIVGVCQASQEAEGKIHWGGECLENSKTGKLAEVDQCICIGKKSYGESSGHDDGFRMANIVKNKLTGIEVPVAFVLQPTLSRIVP